MSKGTIREKDREFIWHPYTQMKLSGENIPVLKGKGVWLYDDKGNAYIDAISSWWVNLHGHSHPYIAEKVGKQMLDLEHVIFAGFTHAPAVELAERLISKLPGDYCRIFYSDNGSTAVEVALKMAFQYHYNQGRSRTRVVAFKDAYHGDTFGAMSVSGRSAFSDPFSPFLFDVEFINLPERGREKESLRQMEQILLQGDVAAFIFEPGIQGTAGMKMYETQALDLLIGTCKDAGVISIADEVMTGFGRTGTLFATDVLENQPEIICLSKGITGGTMALGVTACTGDIYQVFLSDDKLKTFFHGHSYTANPIACTAALASLDLLENDQSIANIRRIHQKHTEFLKKLESISYVSNTRLKGTILAFDIDTGSATSYFHDLRDRLYAAFISKGVLLRPLGNIIYIMPPYCINDAELDKIYMAIIGVLKEELQDKTI